ncbi:hypothetical protein OG225_41390 (plasmid) [Nocardia sp. NBC_01377]|uniref:hypothetical protein n=1 Tax=Nocardia sp. NBC_01377 TaxID=2903595 RepID=UPI002F912504
MSTRDDDSATWWVLLWESLLRPILIGWQIAENVFRPEFRLIPKDILVDRLASVRASAGLAINVILLDTFIGDRSEQVLTGLLIRPLVPAVIGVPVSLVAIGVFVVISDIRVRSDTVREMKWPLRTLGLGALFVSILAALPFVVRIASTVLWALLGGWAALVMLLVFPVFLAVGLALAALVLRMVFLVAKYWFNAADGHPLLAPVIAIVVSWLSALVDVLTDGPNSLPTGLYAITLCGSVITITALSGFEIHRIRSKHGAGFRSGPYPRRLPAPGRPEHSRKTCRQCESALPFWTTDCVWCDELTDDQKAGRAQAAVGALIVVTILAAVFLHRSGPSTRDTRSATHTAPPGTAEFVSPSGNIACRIEPNATPPAVVCEATDIAFTAPPVPDCDSNRYGHVVVLVVGDRPRFPCAPQPLPSQALPRLPYGSHSTAGPFTCDSAENGVTCRDTGTGNGFRLARETYDLF